VRDGVLVNEIRILNPGDTEYKVGQVVGRDNLDKANNGLAPKKHSRV